MNPTYIDSTIQRISAKYGCSQINNHNNFQSFTRSPDYIVIPYPKNYITFEEEAPKMTLVNNKCNNKCNNKFYDWPQISTIIVPPKTNNKPKSKSKSKKS